MVHKHRRYTSSFSAEQDRVARPKGGGALKDGSRVFLSRRKKLINDTMVIAAGGTSFRVSSMIVLLGRLHGGGSWEEFSAGRLRTECASNHVQTRRK